MDPYLPATTDQFIHIRTILGVVMGLSVTRLLTGLAKLIQHPGRVRLYPLHLAWVAFLFLTVIHFWWFQFSLEYIRSWKFEFYFFLICYAALFFLQCAILFPDDMAEYWGFRHYFHARQRWFYGLLALLTAVDAADTLWKGMDHFVSLGSFYLIRESLMIGMALAAMFIYNRCYHLAFVSVALFLECWWILANYQHLGVIS